MTREEKIQYLKDLLAGTIRLEKKKNIRMEVSFKSDPVVVKWFLNDQEVTLAEFQEYSAKQDVRPNINDDNFEAYFDGRRVKDPHYRILEYLDEYEDNPQGFADLLQKHPHINKDYQAYLQSISESTNAHE